MVVLGRELAVLGALGGCWAVVLWAGSGAVDVGLGGAAGLPRRIALGGWDRWGCSWLV